MSSADQLRREHGVAFSREMVHALLAGRKRQTRRVIAEDKPIKFSVGDLIWVREAYGYMPDGAMVYLADLPTSRGGASYKSGRFMPKRFARIWLEITSVSTERLADIAKEDVRAEGFIDRRDMMELWKRLHGSWDNPLVVVLHFERTNNET